MNYDPQRYDDLMPNDSMAVFGFRLVMFYDEDGQIAYRYALDENVNGPITSLLGALTLATNSIATWANSQDFKIKIEQGDPPEDDEQES